MERKLNIATFFILPLIDNNITFSDYISAGFIDLYTEDINRPYLNDKIILMFNSTKLHSSTILRILRINKNFYNEYSIRIKGEWCKILVFIKPLEHKYELSIMQKTPQLIAYKTKIQLLSYWHLDITNKMHQALFEGFEIQNYYKSIPEEDLVFKSPADELLFEEEVDTK